MKFFVTGAAGQLGFDVLGELQKRGHSAVGSDLAPIYQGIASSSIPFPYVSLDICDQDAVRQVLTEEKPDVVVHCAAWTAVDAAEEEENREKVMKINGDGTENIARVCKEIGAKMIYISTDYVFGGEGNTPWQAEEENFSPLNVYGESKLRGEMAVRDLLERYFIVRIAWVFGKNGNNFIKTMLRVGKTHESVRVVSDQVGTPTYTLDLSRLLVDMGEGERYGTYHATNEGGYLSWYEFCCEIYRQAGLSTKVIPVTTEEYGKSLAKRPFNSRLDKSKLLREGFCPLPAWQDALRRYLKEIEE